MLNRIFSLIMMLSVVLVACNANTSEQNAEDDQQGNNVQPIRYNTDERGNNLDYGQQGGYPQSELDELHDDGVSERTKDKYVTEEGMKVSEHLQERKDIKQAQVAVTEDRVVVAVTLNEYLEHHEIAEDIRKDVKQFIPDKTVVVYTDDYYWKRMRNLNARDLGNDIEQFLENFFNLD